MGSEFEIQPPDITVGAPELPPAPPPPPRGENPVWSGWDIIYILLVTFTMIMLSLWFVAWAAHRIMYPHNPVLVVMAFPMVAFSSQMLAYALVLGFMFTTVTSKTREGFWKAIRWNLPRRWPLFLLIGAASCVVLQLLAHLLPMPKKIPMQAFFETPLRAWAIAIFGMSFIPLMEELFFRGFLYPVLARRLGLVIAIVLTSVSFAAIHLPQLEDPHMPLRSSWGAIVIILLIGTVLTIIRALQKSVAAGVLVHIGYNGLTSILAMIATSGFRHMERLSQ